MLIETARLRIFPLSASQISKYLACDFSLESELGLKPLKREIPDELMDTIRDNIIPILKNHPDDLYFTIWLMTDNSSHDIVGSFLLKGLPDKKGEVEIGYGTEPQFQQRGYMQEALSGFILWAKKQSRIKSIRAETNPDNIASQQVLIKKQFYRKRDEGRV
ncbi:MAG: GNAT family N-acetyltransferase [Bacteroidia bacterium]